MPVFFFIDRDIIDEPQLDGLDDVVLSYTFFRWVPLVARFCLS